MTQILNYILWDTSNKKNWQIAAKGTYEECERSAGEDWRNPQMTDMEIHANRIKDRWNNILTKIHYDVYMDDTVDYRPMTAAEIEGLD